MSGSLCIDSSMPEGCVAGRCATYCDLLAGDGPCLAINPDYVCEPFFTEPLLGHENLGVCLLPQ